MNRRIGILIMQILLVGIFTLPVFAIEVPVYNSGQLFRTAGPPNIYSESFTSNPGAARIIVLNGDSSGSNRVSSAQIFVNGFLVVKQNQFNKKVYRIETPVELSEDNLIEVRMTSSPGSYLAVMIQQDIPLTVTINDPKEDEQIPSTSITVSGTLAATSRYIEINVNNHHALVNGSNFIAPGIPLEPGMNTITATAIDTAGNTVAASIRVNQQIIPQGWLKMLLRPEGAFAPLETEVTIEPHFQGTPNWNTGVLNHNGPSNTIVDQVSEDKYRLVFSDPGFYSISYEIQDEDGNLFTEIQSVSVLKPFTREDWTAMNESIQQFKDSFSSLLENNDAETARLHVLEQAQSNPLFSRATLSGNAVNLIFKVLIPVILDLPDPSDPPTDG